MDAEEFLQDPEENLHYETVLALEDLRLGDEDTSTKEESSVSSDSSHSHRGGRPKHPETSLFIKFLTTKKHRPVKKETLRIYFYRGVRVCLSCLKRKKPMSRRINSLFKGSSGLHYHAYMSNLREFVPLLNSSFIEPKKIGEHSHNDRFFRRVFQVKGVKECMEKYLSFVIFDTDPGVISERLNITCCLGAKHEEKCQKKWEELKKFCTEQLFSFD